MPSTKEDGTATAAEQLGSMSLGESEKRKDNDTEPDAKNGTNPTKKLCSACGKKGDALMKCRACKCVWYCDKKCQNKHRKVHKHECRLIKKELDKRGGKLDLGKELDIGPIEKLPPREECPICMQVLPIPEKLSTYYPCCGKSICGGCNFKHQMKSEGRPTCAFCRTPMTRSDEEETLARLRKRVELKDPKALLNMAMVHGEGQLGLPVDQSKCLELLRESADLGHPPAQYDLGCYYSTGEMGLVQNEEEAERYWEKTIDVGHVHAHHNLGNKEGRNGNHVATMRHFRLAAAGGFRGSMENLIECFELGLLHHGDLAATLQAYYRTRAEMKSEDRELYIKYLKAKGEYEAEYDM